MKRSILVLFSLGLALCSFSAFADDIGVIDTQVLQTSPQVKAINAKLDKKFSGQRNKIIAEGKALQDDIKKLQRNKSVMSKKDLAALKDKIAKQEASLRSEQAEFQKTVFAAQNEAMNDFKNKVDKIVADIAKKKDLDIVFPSAAVVYSKDKMDITAEVMKQLK